MNLSPDLCNPNENGKGKVTRTQSRSMFRVGDHVYLIVAGVREGPYKIETVPQAGRYTLCLEDGTSAKDGEEVEEPSLELKHH
ncbi:hypothetical protein SCUP234_07304 [Seiridium cupressi]